MDSIKKRYIYTLFSRIVGLFLGIITAGMIPRSLGPANYGNYQFLQDNFNQIRNMTDFSISSAFFNHSSSHLKSGASIIIFSFWELIQIISVFIFITISCRFNFYGSIWPHQNIILIYSVFGIVTLQFIQSRLISFGDSKALTASVQIIGLLVNILMVVLVVLAFIYNILDIKVFIYINYIVVMASIISLLIYFIEKRNLFFSKDFTRKRFNDIIKYFFKFSSPLVIYSFIAFLYCYFNRWFLQIIDGSRQQGFYSLALSLSQIVLIFTTSMLPIYMREVVFSYKTGDIDKVRILYSKSLKMLFFLTSFIAVFIASQSKFIITVFAGHNYNEAIIPFFIMSFYPIHQTYGQISGGLFFATMRTKLYSVLGIAFMLMGFVLSYLFIAPTTYFIPGLGLGAIGLALQMVITQFMAVNIQLIFNCRFLKIPIKDFIIHQLATVLLMIIMAQSSKHFVSLIVHTMNVFIFTDWIIFFLSGIIYSIVIIIIVVMFPGIFCIDISDFKLKFLSILKGMFQ